MLPLCAGMLVAVGCTGPAGLTARGGVSAVGLDEDFLQLCGLTAVMTKRGAV